MQEKNHSQTPQIIAIRYTCDHQGEQVGLTHYLMIQGRKR